MRLLVTVCLVLLLAGNSFAIVYGTSYSDIDDTVNIPVIFCGYSVSRGIMNGQPNLGNSMWELVDSLNRFGIVKAAGRTANFTLWHWDKNGDYLSDSVGLLYQGSYWYYYLNGGASVFPSPNLGGSAMSFADPSSNHWPAGIFYSNNQSTSPTDGGAYLFRRHTVIRDHGDGTRDTISQRYAAVANKQPYRAWGYASALTSGLTQGTQATRDSFVVRFKRAFLETVDSVAAVLGDSMIYIWVTGTPMRWDADDATYGFSHDTAQAKMVYQLQTWVCDTALYVNRRRVPLGQYGNFLIWDTYRPLCDTTAGIPERYCLAPAYVAPTAQSHPNDAGYRVLKGILTEGIKRVGYQYLYTTGIRKNATCFNPYSSTNNFSYTNSAATATADSILARGTFTTQDGNSSNALYQYLSEDPHNIAPYFQKYTEFGPYHTLTDADLTRGHQWGISQYMKDSLGYADDGAWIHALYPSIASQNGDINYRDTFVGAPIGSSHLVRKANRLRSAEYGHRGSISRYLTNMFAGSQYMKGLVWNWRQTSYYDSDNSATYYPQPGIFTPIGGDGYVSKVFFDNAIFRTNVSITRETRVPILAANQDAPSRVYYRNPSGAYVNATTGVDPIPIDSLARGQQYFYFAVDSFHTLKGDKAAFNEIRFRVPYGRTCTAGCGAPRLWKYNNGTWEEISLYDHPGNRAAYFTSDGNFVLTWRPEPATEYQLIAASTWSSGGISDATARYWYRLDLTGTTGNVAFTSGEMKIRYNGFFVECDCPWRTDDAIEAGTYWYKADSIYFLGLTSALRYITGRGNDTSYWGNSNYRRFQPNTQITDDQAYEINGGFGSPLWPYPLWRSDSAVGQTASPEGVGSLAWTPSRRYSPLDIFKIDTVHKYNSSTGGSRVFNGVDWNQAVLYYTLHPDTGATGDNYNTALAAYFRRYGYQAFFRFEVSFLWCAKAGRYINGLFDGGGSGIGTFYPQPEWDTRKHDPWIAWMPPDPFPVGSLVDAPLVWGGSAVVVNGYSTYLYYRSYRGLGVHPPTYYFIVRPTNSASADNDPATLASHLSSTYDYTWTPGFTFQYARIDSDTRQWSNPVTQLNIGVATAWIIKTTEEAPSTYPQQPSAARFDSVCTDGCGGAYTQTDQYNVVVTTSSETGNDSVFIKYGTSAITDMTGAQIRLGYLPSNTYTQAISIAITEPGYVYGGATVSKNGVSSNIRQFSRFTDRVIQNAVLVATDTLHNDFSGERDSVQLRLNIPAGASSVPDSLYVIVSPTGTPADHDTGNRTQLAWIANTTYTVKDTFTLVEPGNANWSWWTHDKDENVWSNAASATRAFTVPPPVNALVSVAIDSLHSDFDGTDMDSVVVTFTPTTQTGNDSIIMTICANCGVYPDSSITYQRYAYPYQATQLKDTIEIRILETTTAYVSAWVKTGAVWSVRRTTNRDFVKPDIPPDALMQKTFRAIKRTPPTQGQAPEGEG